MSQKKLPLINSAHGSETRNIINELIKLFNDMGYTYNESLQKAQDILAEAQQTNDMNESVQQQINTLIAESGTSDAEVLQARIDAEGNEYQVLKGRLDEKEQNFSTQLTETTEVTRNIKNALMPLPIQTYDNFNQTTHPDVMYFEDGWNGYKYWMAHTPYPFTNDFYENPSISVSNDGVDFNDFPGLKNPLDSVTQEESADGEHLSDTALVYIANSNTLECWYRFKNKTTGYEEFRRRTTTDGVNWTPIEVVFVGLGLSPSVIFEDGKYKMWTVDITERPFTIEYRESTTLPNWSAPIKVPINFSSDENTHEPWHLQVFKEGNTYNLILNTFVSGYTGQRLMWGVSNNGKEFNNVQTILTSNDDLSSWDGDTLYRSSAIKVGNIYRLYYSARSHKRMWHVGLVEGVSLDKLKSTGNFSDGNAVLNKKFKVIDIEAKDLVRAERMSLINPDESPYLRFLHTGKSGAGIKTSDSSNMLEIVNDSNTNLGDLKLSRILGLVLSSPSGDNIRIESTPLIDRPAGSKPEIVFREVGVRSLKMWLDSGNTFNITTESGNVFGHLKVASVVFGDTSIEQEGAIRFNRGTKKHQGYDGTTWHDLY